MKFLSTTLLVCLIACGKSQLPQSELKDKRTMSSFIPLGTLEGINTQAAWSLGDVFDCKAVLEKKDGNLWVTLVESSTPHPKESNQTPTIPIWKAPRSFNFGPAYGDAIKIQKTEEGDLLSITEKNHKFEVLIVSGEAVSVQVKGSGMLGFMGLDVIWCSETKAFPGQFKKASQMEVVPIPVRVKD